MNMVQPLKVVLRGGPEYRSAQLQLNIDIPTVNMLIKRFVQKVNTLHTKSTIISSY